MRISLLICLCVVALSASSTAQTQAARAASIDPSIASGFTWRNVGPFRAGRVAGVTGVVGQPGVFYFGAPAGGVWKTTNAGATWYPVFDSVKHVSSVGAIEVAPSDPNVIYVGMGDMLTGGGVNIGDGVYKSTDAGRTWRHLGLDSTQHIPSMIVDPRDANIVMVAAKGDVFAKNDARGVFRSADGGATWTKTLYVDDQTGLEKLARAYDAPDVIFAATNFFYQQPGPRRATTPPDTARTRTRIYKSTDNGLTWREIAGTGLPRLTGRTSVAVAQGTNAQRVYLTTNAGFFRSDDGGQNWRRMAADDKRIMNGQGGYNCGVYVDPKNADVVYVFNTAAYKSTDGGNTFTGFKGAPGGDDPQQMWIDPTDGKRMLMGYDQGAIVSLDGGATWSSWYNQSTEQVYHVATDDQFPYSIYATQQDAGAIATKSRGNLGSITSLDWKPVPGWEWGTIRPDPRDPNTVWATGLGVSKISYPSETWVNVGPNQDPSLGLRGSVNGPLVFATWNGRREMLVGYQYLMATADGGVHWTKLGPDLTVPHPGAPAVADGANGKRDSTPPSFASLESIAVSTVTPGVIWVGANNGVVQVTRDHGRTWTDVTVPGTDVANRPLIPVVEASPRDAASAYVVLDGHYRGDNAPHVYRTSDFGKTWTRIDTGLPQSLTTGAFARVVRADPKRRGLLFAGTESGMYVSVDDGDTWQLFMGNLPNTSYRDIAIHDNDLIVGTYGRGVWVLDDYAAIRQMSPALASEPARLFKSSDVVRVRRNVNYNTPFPPEIPQAVNPPEGVILTYWLASKPANGIALDVLDASGNVVRHLSSATPPPVREAARPPEPNFWIAPPFAIPANAGLNRTHWDLRYDPPPAFAHSFEINANPGQTPPSPEGPLALPGTYTLRLTVDGKRYTEPVVVRPDPRVHVAAGDLAAQHALLMQLYSGSRASWTDFKPVADLRDRVARLATDTTSATGKAATALAAKIDSIAGDPNDDPRYPWLPRPTAWSFVALNSEFALQLNAQDNGDQAPTEATLALARSTCGELKKTADRWQKLVATDLTAFNGLLQRNNTPALAAPSVAPDLCSHEPQR